MAESEKPRLPASLAARFHVLGIVGKGGFGVVYRARQRDLARLVAIKVLHPQYLDQEQARSRFESEARVVSRLSHPSVVPVLDFGLDDEAAYIVFPFVEGGSLRERMDRGVLPWLEAVPHLVSMLEALAYIHGEGIVHRDLKPENVMLEGGTLAMLTDFGISKPAGTTFNTGQGMVLGTPGYLPPEILTGDAATPAADLFAVGVIAWEMLCGRRPYEPEEEGDPTSPRVIVEELRLARLGPPHAVPPGAEGLPGDLDRFFDKLLTPRLGERVALASDALTALMEVAEGHSQTRARMKRPSRTRASTGGRTLVASRPPIARDTTLAARAPSRPRSPLVLAAVSLVTSGLVGAAILWSRWGAGSGGTPSTRITAASDRAPEVGDRGAATRSAAVSPHRLAVAGLVEGLERAPIVLRPWGGPGGAGEYDCPLIIVPADRLRSVGVQAASGCELVAVNGSLVTDRRGQRVEVDPRRFRRGLNWIRVSCPGVNMRAAQVWLELEAGAPPPPPAPPLEESRQYDALRCILSGDTRDVVGDARSFLEKTIAPGEPLMIDVGKALIELNYEAVWNRRWEADEPGLVLLPEDPYWLEKDTLALSIKMLDTVQRALARWPDRQVLWSNLGWVLRKARQPEAARIALVEALRLWPEAHWSWLELAQLERKLGESDPARLVSPEEGLERVRASAEYYDWASRFFASAGSGHPQKVWSTYVKYVVKRRAQVPAVVARAREALTPASPSAGQRSP